MPVRFEQDTKVRFEPDVPESNIGLDEFDEEATRLIQDSLFYGAISGEEPSALFDYADEINKQSKSSSQINQGIIDEIVSDSKIGTLGLGQGLLGAVKKRAMQLSGAGIFPDENIKHQFEVLKPDRTKPIVMPKDQIGQTLNRRLQQGSRIAESFGILTRLPDVGIKLLQEQTQKESEKLESATLRTKPITTLLRPVIQNVPQYAAAIGIGLISGDPITSLAILGETEGGNSFITNLDRGDSLRKATFLSELSEAAEIGGEMLVLPKVFKGFDEGLTLKQIFNIAVENAGQEGATGFTQEFINTYGLETGKGTDVKTAIKLATGKGLMAIPENAWTGGIMGGGGATVVSVSNKISEYIQSARQEAIKQQETTDKGETPAPDISGSVDFANRENLPSDTPSDVTEKKQSVIPDIIKKDAEQHKTIEEWKRKEFSPKSKYEYHLSTNPNLIEGKKFSEQITEQIQERGGEEGLIYTTKTPQMWEATFAEEKDNLNAIEPREIYLVRVENPSQETTPYGHESVSPPEEVVILKKIGNADELFGSERISISELENNKYSYLQSVLDEVQRKPSPSPVTQGTQKQVWYHGGQSGMEGDVVEGMVTKSLEEAQDYAKQYSNGVVYEIPNDAVIPATQNDKDNNGIPFGANAENYGFIKPVKAGEKGYGKQVIDKTIYQPSPSPVTQGTQEKQALPTKEEWDAKPDFIPATMQTVDVQEKLNQAKEELKTVNQVNAVFVQEMIRLYEESLAKGITTIQEPLPPPIGYSTGKRNDTEGYMKLSYKQASKKFGQPVKQADEVKPVVKESLTTEKTVEKVEKSPDDNSVESNAPPTELEDIIIGKDEFPSIRAANETTNKLREDMGLDVVGSKTRLSDREAYSNAIKKGYVENALAISNDVIQTGRALNTEEIFGLDAATVRRVNKRVELLKKLRDTKDKGEIQSISAQLDTLSQEITMIVKAFNEGSGVEQGRAFRARQVFLNHDLEIEYAKAEATAKKGDVLTEKENKQLEELMKKYKDLQAEYQTLKEKLENKDVETVHKTRIRKKNKIKTKEQLDTEIMTKSQKLNELLEAGCV